MAATWSFLAQWLVLLRYDRFTTSKSLEIEYQPGGTRIARLWKTHNVGSQFVGAESRWR